MMREMQILSMPKIDIILGKFSAILKRRRNFPMTYVNFNLNTWRPLHRSPVLVSYAPGVSALAGFMEVIFPKMWRRMTTPM